MTDQPNSNSPAPAPVVAEPVPAAATAAAPATATVLNGTNGVVEPAVAAPATWPDDWRDKFAAGDAKLLDQLKRFSSPEMVGQSWRSLAQKLSTGELRAALPKDAKPEQIAEWRKDNGIPEKPDDYTASLPQGLVIGDDDKKTIGDFFKAAHDVNAPPAVVGKMVDWYYKNLENLQVERTTQDQTAVKSAEDALRAKYGNDYRLNLTGLEHLFGRAQDGTLKGSFYMPDGVAGALYNARTADGTPILADPAVIDWFVTTSRELHPDVFRTIVPSSPGVVGAGLDTRITEIETVMRTDRKTYNKSPAMQKEYQDLLAAKERQSSRAA